MLIIQMTKFNPIDIRLNHVRQYIVNMKFRYFRYFWIIKCVGFESIFLLLNLILRDSL